MTDNERFAPLFGFICKTAKEVFETLAHFDPEDILWSESEEIDFWEESYALPDFCDIRGPYFGPACEELLTEWLLHKNPNNDGYYEWLQDTPKETIIISDPDLGRATMLALEAKRRLEK